MVSNKKILLVSNGFYPEISPRSYRATELAKEFLRQGHNVTVITKYRDVDYTSFLSEFPIGLKMWSKSIFKPVPISSNRFLSILSSVVARFLLLFFEYPAIIEMFKVRNMLKSEKGYDLMISFAVPHPVHWGVAFSRSVKHRIANTWIADCGDPYMGDRIDTFRKLFYFGYFEKKFCRRADYITIPIGSAKDAYYAEFHNKIRIIPQGFQFNLDLTEPEKINNQIPSFAYAGGFITGVRDPLPLLYYLISLKTPFKFIIYTNTQEILNEVKHLLGDRLEINGYIPREELMIKLKKMDFLINFDNNTKLNSPSKLIDYAILNRPVLNISKDFNAEEVLNFINGNYSNKMVLPEPGQFHITNVTNSFIELLS